MEDTVIEQIFLVGKLALPLIVSYLIGSIPAGVIVGKLFGKIDIRDFGSGNTGATNVWRELGWKAGLIVIVVDVGKGFVAASAIASMFSVPYLSAEVLAVACGVAAVLGHVFPVYTRFRGGKGVATGGGMMIAVAPIPVGIAIGVFGVVILVSRQVSLGSIVAALSVPVSILLLEKYTRNSYPPILFWLTVALFLFILFTHRSNIVRLIRGEERRIG